MIICLGRSHADTSKCDSLRKRSTILMRARLFGLFFGPGAPSLHPHRSDLAPSSDPHRCLSSSFPFRASDFGEGSSAPHRYFGAPPSSPPHRGNSAPSSDPHRCLSSSFPFRASDFGFSGLRFWGGLIGPSSLFWPPPSSPPHRLRFLFSSTISEACAKIWKFCEFLTCVTNPSQWMFSRASCRSSKPTSEEKERRRETNAFHGPGLLTFAHLKVAAFTNTQHSPAPL